MQSKQGYCTRDLQPEGRVSNSKYREWVSEVSYRPGPQGVCRTPSQYGSGGVWAPYQPIIEKLRTYSIIYQDISYLEFYRHVLEKCWNYRYDNILATGRKHFQKCFVNQPLSLTKIIMKHGIKSSSSQLSITICIRMFGSMRVQMCFTVKRSNEIMNCTKLNNVVLKQIFIHFSIYELSNDCLFTYLADTE